MTISWDFNGGMTLSDGNESATNPGNSGVVSAQANVPVTPGQKVVFEVITSHLPPSQAGTALQLGFATLPWDRNADRFDPNPNPNRYDGIPSSSTSVSIGWDNIVQEDGYFVTPNADRYTSVDQNNGTVTVALDYRSSGTALFWWKSSLTNQWNQSASANPSSGTGGYVVHLNGATVYPLVGGWTLGGTEVTLIAPSPVAGFTSLTPGGGGGGGGSSQGGGGDIVTLPTISGFTAGVQPISGSETDATQPVWVDWRNSGTPANNASDWVQASVAANGHFSASVNVDHPGVSGTMYYREGSGSAVAAWTDIPLDPSGNTIPGSGGTPPPMSFMADIPRVGGLTAGVQAIAGTVTDHTQSVWVDWHTHDIPAVSATDWVQATVNHSTGAFSAMVDVDHAGTASTMYYHVGSGPVTAAWTDTPK